MSNVTIEVIEQPTYVTAEGSNVVIDTITETAAIELGSSGPQGPQGNTGATGATGAQGPSGVISVTSPLINSGTSTAAAISIDRTAENTINDARYARLESANAFTDRLSVTPPAITGSALIEAAALAGQAYPLVMGRVGSAWVAAINPTGFDSYMQARFIPTNSSTIPMTVRGASGQTAALTEWQQYNGSTSTAVAWMTNSGELRASGVGNRTSYLNSMIYPNDSGTHIYTAQAANIALKVQNAATTPTGNLTEWVANTTTVAAIDTNGTLRANYATNPTNSATAAFLNFQSSAIGLYSRNAAATVFFVRGAVSQTANMQEWQNDTGGIIARVVGSSGSIYTAGISVVGQVTAPPVGTQFYVLAANATQIGAVVRMAASATANALEIQDSTGAILSRVTSVGAIFANSGPGYFATGPALGVRPTSAAGVGLAIQGVASQTGNLTEWQDSTPSTTASMSVDGQLSALATNTQYVQGRPSTNFPYLTFSGNALVLRTRQPSYLGLVVQGEAAQTADITRWQSSTASVYLRVDSGGSLFANSSAGNYAVGTNVGIKASSASVIPLSVAAASGQTADVTRWYAADGTTVIASIGSTGNATIGSQLTFANPGIGNETKFVFNKQSDGAELRVVERANDQTFYEFYMRDNATGGDYFQWTMLNYESGSLGWMPLQMGGFTTRHIAQSHVFWGNLISTVNTPFYTTNNATSTVAGTEKEIVKYAPYNSTTYNLQLDLGTGTGTLNVDINGYTGSVQQRYWVQMQSATTFKWGYGFYQGTATATGVTITGGWQLLADGVYVKLSGTGYVAGDLWSWAAYPVTKLSLGGTPLTNTLASLQPAAGMTGLMIKMAASPTQDPFAIQNTGGTKVFRVDTGGNLKTPNLGTTNSFFQAFENNSGAGMILKKQTAAQGNPGAEHGALYFRDGTNAGTLKLVVRAGAGGAETTILDNIPT